MIIISADNNKMQTSGKKRSYLLAPRRSQFNASISFERMGIVACHTLLHI